MVLSVTRQLQIWGVLGGLLILALWLLGDVMLPFVLGAALAYAASGVVVVGAWSRATDRSTLELLGLRRRHLVEAAP